jgi:hypothetical protein
MFNASSPPWRSARFISRSPLVDGPALYHSSLTVRVDAGEIEAEAGVEAALPTCVRGVQDANLRSDRLK